MLCIDNPAPERLIFDWRRFMYTAPLTSDITSVTAIHSNELFPKIYGHRFYVPSPDGDLPLILTSPENSTDLSYWFPCSPTLWVKPELMPSIYSLDLLPPEESNPAYQGNQALRYPGLLHFNFK